MKTAFLVTVTLITMFPGDNEPLQSETAKKALLQFTEERRKIEERYQDDFDKAVERLTRRLESAKKERLKRGDVADAMRIEKALLVASAQPRTPERLQKELTGTRWTWRTSGGGTLQIVFGDGWYQLSDQKVRTLFVPSSGNQVNAQTKDNARPEFSITFSDDLQRFLYFGGNQIRIGSRIE